MFLNWAKMQFTEAASIIVVDDVAGKGSSVAVTTVQSLIFEKMW